jgi:hypothetical protein
MARRFVIALLTLAALAGTASAAVTKAGDPKKRHNAADQAWAERMRIQRDDLGAGDWRVEPPDPDNDRGAPKVCKDPNMSDLVETGSSEEPNFSRNNSFVSSSSVVFQTAAQLRTAYGRLARAPLNECLTWAFKQGAAASGARVRVSSFRSIRVSHLAPLGKAARVDLVVSGPAASIRGHISYYLLARGRASVLLMIASFGRPATPISASLERQLTTVVGQRLRG